MHINSILLSSMFYNIYENWFDLKMVAFSFICNFSKFLEGFISYGSEIESNPTKMDAINQKLLPLIRLLERK